MPKQIISDTFETLGGVVQSTAGQVKQAVKQMGGDVAESLGLKPVQQQTQGGDAGNPPQQTEEQTKKIEQAAKKRADIQYRQIQGEIRAIEEGRKKELPKQITGKPGFSEEKAIKQLEEKKTEGKKLPPLPVRQASRKAEMFRGVSG